MHFQLGLNLTCLGVWQLQVGDFISPFVVPAAQFEDLTIITTARTIQPQLSLLQQEQRLKDEANTP